MRLDSFYLLSSLWGGLTEPQVCISTAYAVSSAAREIVMALVPGATTGVTAFVDVNVVPMDHERVLANQTVLVDGGRIIALGPSDKVKVPAGAMRIDGYGKYLIPGLADMHNHEYSANFGKAMMRDNMFRELASGVTIVRNNEPANLDDIPKWLRFTAAEVPVPHVYFTPKIPMLRPDSVAGYVTAAKAAGFRYLGVPFHLEARGPDERAAFDSLVAVARRVGLPVSAHAHRLPFDAGLAIGSTGGSAEHPYVLWDSLELQETFINPPGARQSVNVPLEKLPALAAAMKRAGLWITPTLTCLERGLTHIKGKPQLIKALHDAGVGLLLGVDAESVHNELAALVRAGLSPYQALLTGTRNSAQVLGLLDSNGTVAVGKRADLVLLYGNPLVDIRHTREPAGVMVEGRWLDRAVLDQHLLASKWWLSSMVDGGLKYSLDLTDPLTDVQLKQLRSRASKFALLTDSLARATPLEAQRVRQRMAEGLGTMRTLLTHEQQELFDPIARQWLREQIRQGHSLVVSGVTLIP